MKTLGLAAIPIALLLAWILWRSARGRPSKRFTLNVILGLGLFAYFAITTGLGIFWVARQELPVFDLHYLFGYLTIAVVLLHVGVNWRPMSKLVLQKAPRRLQSDDGHEWGLPVRAVGWIVALGVLGFVCFCIGRQRGASTITIAQRVLSPVVAPALASETGSLPAPTRPQEQLVVNGGKEVPVATYYQRKTTYARTDDDSGSINWAQRPEPFKYYPGAELVPLPRDFARKGLSTTALIERARAPAVGLFPRVVTLQELSTLLHMTNGVTAEKDMPGRHYYLRAAPSAGALYPTLTYVVARSVEGLAPGLYHYDVKGHALQRVKDGFGVLGDLASTTSDPSVVRGASFALVFTTEYFRTAFKYGARSYRYSLLDAGHVAGNATLAAEYLGLSSRMIARFDDGALNALLGIDEAHEAALLVVPVGQRDAAPFGPRIEPAFESAPQTLANKSLDGLILLAHGQTDLRRAPGGPAFVRAYDAPQVLSARDGDEVTLPPPSETTDDAFATIEKRRSARHWTTDGMDLAQLSSVLHASFGTSAGQPHASVEDGHALRIYVVALRVRGLATGAYAYDPVTHSLRLRAPGDVKKQAFEMSLMQECAGDSDAVIVKTADVERVAVPDGSRGYRYAGIDAGLVGERLYLTTVALGLGTTGIGAFFDDEVSALLRIDPAKEHVLYLSAIGKVPPNEEHD
jgi:SagB-type dehydrogenase family enzyme